MNPMCKDKTTPPKAARWSFFHVYPFTDPIVRPLMKYFWKNG